MGEIQGRSYLTAQRSFHSTATATRPVRKATLLQIDRNYDSEYYSDSDHADDMDLDSNDNEQHQQQQQQQQQRNSDARRRRIYEHQYNRPYPTQRRMHLWTDPESTGRVAISQGVVTPEAGSSAINSSKATAGISNNRRSTLITPSPTRKLDRAQSPTDRTHSVKTISPQEGPAWNNNTTNSDDNSLPKQSKHMTNAPKQQQQQQQQQEESKSYVSFASLSLKLSEYDELDELIMRIPTSRSATSTPSSSHRKMIHAHAVTPTRTKDKKNINGDDFSHTTSNASTPKSQGSRGMRPDSITATAAAFAPTMLDASTGDTRQFHSTNVRSYGRNSPRANTTMMEINEEDEISIVQGKSPPLPPPQKTQSIRKQRSTPRRSHTSHENHEGHVALHQFLKESEENSLKLYIDDYQESTFDRIVESLYGNSTLRILAVCRGTNTNHLGNGRTLAEMKCLFEAIRCLPYLETLLLWNTRPDILPILGKNLPNSLVKLNLHVVEGPISPSFLDGLAGKPHLTNIQLECTESFELGRLVDSPVLQSIKVVGTEYSFHTEHIQDLADALARSTDSQLVSLDIEPNLDLESLKALSEGLWTNTSVKYINVSFLGESQQERDGGVMVVADLLKYNRTLTKVINHMHTSVTISSSKPTDYMLSALHTNMTIQEIRFFKEENMFWATKEALLKRNLGYDMGYKRENNDPTNILYKGYENVASSLAAVDWRLCGGFYNNKS